MSTIVQHVTDSFFMGATGSEPEVFPNANVQGNAIIVTVSITAVSANDAQTILNNLTVNDTNNVGAGNYPLVAQTTKTTFSTFTGLLAVFALANINAGANTVSLNLGVGSGSGSFDVIVEECDAAGAVDGTPATAENTSYGAGTGFNSGNVSTSNGIDYLHASFANLDNEPIQISVDSGFVIQTVFNDNSNAVALATADVTEQSNGTYSVNWICTQGASALGVHSILIAFDSLSGDIVTVSQEYDVAIN
jgi:hypothetical protein